MTAKAKGKAKRSVKTQPKRRELTVEEYAAGVREGDRSILGRAITLVESNALKHRDKAEQLLQALLPYTGHSIRVGITGAPGVGKSSFIDALGEVLTGQGAKVAVLAIDPSSSLTRGSILGDKTRLERLARHPRAFIRPSPAGDTLGGVARKTRESALVCEAASYDIVLIETVGVGQNETAVRSMVDFFVLLIIAGAGDELQGIKRGIIELADAIVINKADGDNAPRAAMARAEYERALHYLLPATAGWQTKAYTCSSLTGQGVKEIWSIVEDFVQQTQASGVFFERRRSQARNWFNALLAEHLKARFFSNPKIARALPAIEESVAKGELAPTAAVERLAKLFDK